MRKCESERLKNGLCIVCGLNPHRPLKRMCESCAAKNRAKSFATLLKNRDKYNENRRQRRIEVIKAYGGKCNCCGESTMEFLTIDHINNDGAVHRKAIGGGGEATCRWLRKHKFPQGFRVLCWNCNSSRGAYGICPHELMEMKSHEQIVFQG